MVNRIVSVIVPVYNEERYLGECLSSICHQSYKNLEIIIIDDGSTDNSPKMIDDWLQMDDRIIARHIENSGVSNARNKGMSIATGEFILFVDSDDILKNNAVFELLKKAEQSEADITVCGIEEFQDEKESIFHSYLKNGDKDVKAYVDALAKYNIDIYFGGPYCKLYSAKLLKNAKVKFEYQENLGEDFIFNLYLLHYVKTIAIVEECLYMYRADNENSISKVRKDTDYFFARYKKMFKCYISLLKKYDLYSIHQKDVQIFLMRIVRMALINVTFDDNLYSLRIKVKKMKELRKNLNDCEIFIFYKNLSFKDKIVLLLLHTRLYYVILFTFHITFYMNCLQKRDSRKCSR